MFFNPLRSSSMHAYGELEGEPAESGLASSSAYAHANLSKSVWIERERSQAAEAVGWNSKHGLPLNALLTAKEFLVHLAYPLSLPFLLLFEGRLAARNHSFLDASIPGVLNFVACVGFWFAVALFLFVFDHHERQAKAPEFLVFFGVSSIRALMIAVKYGYRTPELLEKSAQRELTSYEQRSEEVIGGWYSLRYMTSQREVDLACAREGLEPQFPLHFRASLSDVQKALQLAISVRPEDAKLVRTVGEDELGGGEAPGGPCVSAPARLWVLQQVLEASPAFRMRAASGGAAASLAAPADGPQKPGATRRIVLLRLLEVPKALAAALHCAIPYFFADQRALAFSRPALSAFTVSVLLIQYLIMHAFILAFMFAAATDYYRRFRWLEAAGRLLCAGRAVIPCSFSQTEALPCRRRGRGLARPGAPAPAPAPGAPRRSRWTCGRPKSHRVAGAGPCAPSGPGPAPLSLDLRAAGAPIAWLRARQWLSDVGRSFHLRIQFFISSFAVVLAGQIAFLIYKTLLSQMSAAASAPVPPFVYVYIAYDLALFGGSLLVCIFYGAKANNLSTEHQYIVLQIKTRIEEGRLQSPLHARPAPPPSPRPRPRVPGCACERSLDLALATLDMEDRLRPVEVVGMRMDFALFRSLISLAVSAFAVALSMFRDDGDGGGGPDFDVPF
eukprot:tig00020660_g12565.t1